MLIHDALSKTLLGLNLYLHYLISYADCFIVDSTAPLINECPSDIHTTLELGVAETALVNWNEPSATDQSGTPQRSRSHSPNTHFPIGVTTVRYSFTDARYNTAVCTFDVIVEAGERTLRYIVQFDFLIQFFRKGQKKCLGKHIGNLPKII